MKKSKKSIVSEINRLLDYSLHLSVVILTLFGISLSENFPKKSLFLIIIIILIIYLACRITYFIRIHLRNKAVWKFLFKFKEEIPKVYIVLPGRNRPKLKREEYSNRPFKYDFAADNIYTVTTMLHHIEYYGINIDTNPIYTIDEFESYHPFPPFLEIEIGSPISNSRAGGFIGLDGITPFYIKDYTIICRKNPEVKYEAKKGDNNEILYDYGLITKINTKDSCILILAGLHTFGQIAIALALNDEHFFGEVGKKYKKLEQFQVIIGIDIKGSWPCGKPHIEKVIRF